MKATEKTIKIVMTDVEELTNELIKEMQQSPQKEKEHGTNKGVVGKDGLFK